MEVGNRVGNVGQGRQRKNRSEKGVRKGGVGKTEKELDCKKGGKRKGREDEENGE
jgi:hypothetical protein